MKNYDVIVIGSGAGMIIVEEALADRLKVALVDRGPLGGTCLNLGCIPSKMLIFPADRIIDIENAEKLGIEAEIKRIDFEFIMNRMRKLIREDQDKIRRSIKSMPGLDYYEGPGHFIGEYTLEINNETIKAKKIFIVAGARPLIPTIKGLESINYLTNETLLALEHRPESLLIIGGGYVGVEYGHFFSALGTRVTLIEMSNRLVQGEEQDISELLRKKMGQRVDIKVNTQALEVKKKKNGVGVIINDNEKDRRSEIIADAVLIAVGRKPNSDLLETEHSGVEVDKRGFVRVDEYLETTKKNIYAFGDIIGRQMFTHVANREAMLAWHNAVHEEPIKMDYTAAPHAVFTYPQIASVGLTLSEAMKNHKVLIGEARYSQVAKGIAMMEEEGFARAIVDAGTTNILGFHIFGPEASTLIQEVIDAMAAGGNIGFIDGGIHIHPAMPEIIQRALANLVEPRIAEIRPDLEPRKVAIRSGGLKTTQREPRVPQTS